MKFPALKLDEPLAQSYARDMNIGELSRLTMNFKLFH